MQNIDLTEEQLGEIKAGISNMTKEELEEAKQNIKEMSKKLENSELNLATLDKVLGGPMPYDYAKNTFEENVDGRSK